MMHFKDYTLAEPPNFCLGDSFASGREHAPVRELSPCLERIGCRCLCTFRVEFISVPQDRTNEAEGANF